MSKIIKRIILSIKNSLWVFLILLTIQSFTFKIPYCIVIGQMLLSISFVFFPWLDKILLSYKIKLKTSNKLFIIISNILIASYIIKPTEESYYKCILPILMFILTWIFIIIYAKHKNKDYNIK